MSIGRNVKFLREKNGMSQSDLARLVGKTSTAINKLEMGQIENPRYLKQLSEIFGVSEVEIRFGNFSDKSAFRSTKADYGMRIVEARTTIGYSRDYLAKQMNISQEYLANVERSYIDLTVDFLEMLATHGLDVNYILTGTRVNQTTASNHNTSNVNGNSMGDGNNISIGNDDNNQE